MSYIWQIQLSIEPEILAWTESLADSITEFQQSPSAQLSAERNNYINMLTILSEKISNIMELNIAMENEILLQENSNNGC